MLVGGYCFAPYPTLFFFVDKSDTSLYLEDSIMNMWHKGIGGGGNDLIIIGSILDGVGGAYTLRHEH